MKVDTNKCIGCGFCVRDCPVDAVKLMKKKAVINDHWCTSCGVCLRVCEAAALVADETMPQDAIECDACPIKCWINAGHIGACHRYRNEEGRLVRLTPLHTFEDVAQTIGPDPKEVIRKPVVTAIGSGTTPGGAEAMKMPRGPEWVRGASCLRRCRDELSSSCRAPRADRSR